MSPESLLQLVLSISDAVFHGSSCRARLELGAATAVPQSTSDVVFTRAADFVRNPQILDALAHVLLTLQATHPRQVGSTV